MARQEKSPLLLSSHSHIFPRKEVANQSEEAKCEPVASCGSYRLGVILCCTLCMIIAFGAQASMSSAMVCMIEDSVGPGGEDGPFSGNWTLINATAHVINLTAANMTNGTDHPWTFDWDKSTQGWAISSFFMGYYASQLPSSVAAARFGPKKVVVISLILASVFQFLAVPAAYYGVSWLYADRVIVGIIDGFLYAPVLALVGQWTPRHETSLFFGIVGMGIELGNVLSYQVSMLACEVNFQGGWPLVFYIMSGLGLFTAVLVIIFVSDSPFNNRLISEKEVKFIAGSIPKHESNSKEALIQIPVKEIMKSMKVWAIVVAQIGSDWLYYFFVTMGPTFLKDVIKLSNFETNLISGLPFLAIIPTIYISGYMCDKLVSKDIVSNTCVRKLNDFICKIIPGGILIGLGFLPAGSTVLAFVLNTAGAVTMAFSYVSWLANPVDLAPAYTGFISGVCEVGAIWVAILVPILFDTLTVDKTREEWQFVFYVTAGLQVFCFIFYVIFGSGELQPWAFHTYKHEYEDIDGNYVTPDLKKELLKAEVSMPRSSFSDSLEKAKSKAAKDTEDLIRSLSLSLGGFRGTSSYEDGVRQAQETRKQSGYREDGSRGEIISELARHERGHKSKHRRTRSDVQGTGVDMVGRFPDHALDVTDNAGVVDPGRLQGILNQVEVHAVDESDDEIWQQPVRRSASPKPTRLVKYGHGDLTLKTNSETSPLSSGQFNDDLSSSAQIRNVKSLAMEIAEALSEQNLHEPEEPARRHVGQTGVVSDKTGTQHDVAGQSQVWQTGGGIIGREEKGDNEQPPTIPDGASNIPTTKDPQMNTERGSSIMVPSEGEPDLTQLGLDDDNRGKKPADALAKRKSTSGRKTQKKLETKDAKQRSGLIKRLFAFNKNERGADVATSDSEQRSVKTDDEDTSASNSDSWTTKSLENGRERRGRRADHVRENMPGKRSWIRGKDNDFEAGD